jgi:uncharacterized protein (DUF983 family)
MVQRPVRESDIPSGPLPGWKRYVLRRVLRKRCPQCGRGELFARFARLHASCSVCGLVYRREQGAMTGSMYLSAAVTECFAVALLLVAWLWVDDWSTSRFLVVALPLVVGFSWLFLPRSMALWVAVEYSIDLSNGEEWARFRA